MCKTILCYYYFMCSNIKCGILPGRNWLTTVDIKVLREIEMLTLQRPTILTFSWVNPKLPPTSLTDSLLQQPWTICYPVSVNQTSSYMPLFRFFLYLRCLSPPAMLMEIFLILLCPDHMPPASESLPDQARSRQLLFTSSELGWYHSCDTQGLLCMILIGQVCYFSYQVVNTMRGDTMRICSFIQPVNSYHSSLCGTPPCT